MYTEDSVVEVERTQLSASERRYLEELECFEQLSEDNIREMINCIARRFYLSLIYRVLAEAIRVGVLFGIRRRISPDFSMNTLWMKTSKL